MPQETSHAAGWNEFDSGQPKPHIPVSARFYSMHQHFRSTAQRSVESVHSKMSASSTPSRHSLDLSHHMVPHIRELGWSPMKVIGKLNPADFGAIALSGGAYGRAIPPSADDRSAAS